MSHAVALPDSLAAGCCLAGQEFPQFFSRRGKTDICNNALFAKEEEP